jgi:hypothetical protein
MLQAALFLCTICCQEEPRIVIARAARALKLAALHCPTFTMQDINMDHHRAAPYAVLWSNINTGFGSRTFESSGDGGGNGNHSASFSTFWNVKYVCR